MSHNGIYRAKDLGTISNLNEYLAFRREHGIDDYSYKDLYLGDYFTINDGTYNATWMVAHFDYYHLQGNAATGSGLSNSPRGVLLISTEGAVTLVKMYTDGSVTNAYKGSAAYTTYCPAIANALQTVLGSYLLNPWKWITNNTNSSISSRAGANWQGASTGAEWVQDRCVLPSEVQLYGCTVASSSWYEVGEATEKLALFNFRNHVKSSRTGFWLRNAASNARFCAAASTGYGATHIVNDTNNIRPLIYIG